MSYYEISKGLVSDEIDLISSMTAKKVTFLESDKRGT